MADAVEILAALKKKADAGELPPKKAGTIQHLHERLQRGDVLTEMQVELLEDLGDLYLK